ncbi:hypothetical protein, partial [Methylobacterium sp. CCH5-D2]|uniref:hypothetical protein n=1 Tax=Methylobacterium sp. CCH5-D2 TaxID=1768765 RepID=UPI0018D253EA
AGADERCLRKPSRPVNTRYDEHAKNLQQACDGRQRDPSRIKPRSLVEGAPSGLNLDTLALDMVRIRAAAATVATRPGWLLRILLGPFRGSFA